MQEGNVNGGDTVVGGEGKPGGKRKFSLGWFFVAFLPAIVYLAATAIASVAAGVFATSSFTASGGDMYDTAALTEYITNYIYDNVMSVTLVSQAVCLAACLPWYYFGFARKSGEKLTFKQFGGRGIAAALCLGLGLQLSISSVLNIIYSLAPKLLEGYAELMGGLELGGGLISLVATAFAAPIVEELIMRGLTLRYLIKAGVPFWGANVVQAALFGAIHGNVVQGLYAFVMGIVLGLVARRYKSVLPSMALHLVVNLSAWLFAFALGSEAVETETTPGDFALMFAFLAAGAGLIVLGWRLIREKKVRLTADG